MPAESKPRRSPSVAPMYEGDVGAVAWITAFIGCVGALALVGGGLAWLAYAVFGLF